MRFPLLIALVLGLTLGVATPSRAAKISVDDMLKKAKAAESANNRSGAARLLADAANRAHKDGDLLAEQKVRRPLEKLLRRARVAGPGDKATSADPTRAQLMVTLLERLDPSWVGAEVSSHAIAYELLAGAVERNDHTGVDTAAKKLAAFARAKGGGAAARMLVRFGAGMLLVRRDRKAGTPTLDPRKHLNAALSMCVKEGWQEPAIFVGGELMCVCLEAASADLAGEAVTAVNGLLPNGCDGTVLARWHQLGKSRLEPFREAPPPEVAAVLALFDGHAKQVTGTVAGASPAGDGKGANTASAPMEKAWQSLKPKKAVLTVRRGKSAFELRHAFDKKFKLDQPYAPGQLVMDGRGAAILVDGQAVALEFIDPPGRNGLPASNPARNPWRAWYWLARGETYTLTRSGRVRIAK